MKPYSRLEKDFLGNERMVFYDENGQMTGVAEIMREADGTLRVMGTVPVEAGSNPVSGIPQVPTPPQAEAPKAYDAASEQLAKGRGQVNKLLTESKAEDPEQRGFKSSTVAIIGIAAFLFAGGFAYFAMSAFNRPLPPPTSGLVTNIDPQTNLPSSPNRRSDETPSSPPPESNVPMPSEAMPGQGVPDSALDPNMDRSRRWIEGGRRRNEPEPTVEPGTDQIKVEDATETAKPPKRKKEKEQPKQNPNDPVDLGRDDGSTSSSGTSTNSGDGTTPLPTSDNQPKD